MGPITSERFCAPQSLSTSAKAKGKAVPGEVRWSSSLALFSIEERQRAWSAASGGSYQRTPCHQRRLVTTTWL